MAMEVVLEDAAETELLGDAFGRLHPEAYYSRFVAKDVRPDGRALGEKRPRQCEQGWLRGCDGSASVRIGEAAGAGAGAGVGAGAGAGTGAGVGGGTGGRDCTWVVCGVRWLVEHHGQSSEDAPSRPRLLIRDGTGAGVPGRGDAAGQQDTAAFLRAATEGILDEEQLVALDGAACIVLVADLTCLADDGAVADAALDALVAALQEVRIPTNLTLDLDDQIVQPESRGEKDFAPLKLRHTPRALTFASFDGQIVADPNRSELDLMQASFSIARDPATDVVHALHKSNGPPITFAQIVQATALVQ